MFLFFILTRGIIYSPINPSKIIKNIHYRIPILCGIVSNKMDGNNSGISVRGWDEYKNLDLQISLRCDERWLLFKYLLIRESKFWVWPNAKITYTVVNHNICLAISYIYMICLNENYCWQHLKFFVYIPSSDSVRLFQLNELKLLDLSILRCARRLLNLYERIQGNSQKMESQVFWECIWNLRLKSKVICKAPDYVACLF